MIAQYGKVISDGLNVHRLPKASSKVVDQLDKGDEVVIHETKVIQSGNKTYTWLDINMPETDDRDQVFGWVDARFIKIDVEEPAPDYSLVPWISISLIVASIAAFAIAWLNLPHN